MLFLDIVAVVTSIAGSREQGCSDGYGTNAGFDCPTGITVDAINGMIYVADTDNHRICQINSMDGMLLLFLPSSHIVLMYMLCIICIACDIIMFLL